MEEGAVRVHCTKAPREPAGAWARAKSRIAAIQAGAAVGETPARLPFGQNSRDTWTVEEFCLKQLPSLPTLTHYGGKGGPSPFFASGSADESAKWQ